MCNTANIDSHFIVVCGFLKHPWHKYRFCNLYIK